MDDFIEVSVIKAPGRRVEVALNGSRTVGDAVAEAGYELEDGLLIKVNGEVSDAETELEDGDTILITKKVKGA